MSEHDGHGWQLFGGIVIMVVATLGLLRAQFALLHDAVLWHPFRGSRTWLHPWQLALACALVFAVGVYVAVDAWRKYKRK